MSDANDASPHPLITAVEISDLEESINIHRFNDKAIRYTKSLGDLVGLTKLGIHLVRIAPGDETTQHHVHLIEEEFLYILSGRGIADIGDEKFEVTAGDFMGFRPGGLTHSMSNPFESDLVYLMGGNRFDHDICDYPRIKRRLYRVGQHREHVDWENIHSVQQKSDDEKS